MKRWGWKTWSMVGAFAVLLVGVTVALVIGLLTHDEPTLMQVCWEGDRITWIDGAPPEENRERCETPEDLIWPAYQLPISVAAAAPPDGQEGMAGSDAAVRDAVDLINSQLGYTHLHARPTGAVADVVVRFGAPFVGGPGTTSADRAAGSCALDRTDGFYRGMVDVRVVGTRFAYQVLLHELCHCALGLADDDFDDGIMAAVIVDDRYHSRMSFDSLRTPDRAAVREAYGHQGAFGCSAAAVR